MGRHGLLSPYADAAFSDFLEQHVHGFGIFTVFGGDFSEGRTDQFLLGGMAGEAGGRLHEFDAFHFLIHAHDAGITFRNGDLVEGSGVGNFEESAVFDVVPAVSIFEDIQDTIVEKHIDGFAKFEVQRKILHTDVFFIRVEFDRLEVRAVPIAKKQVVVVIIGKRMLRLGRVIDFADDGAAAPVEMEGFTRNGQIGDAGVVFGEVLELVGIERFTGQIVEHLGIGNHIGPAVVAGGFCLVDFLSGGFFVGSDLAPVKRPGFGVQGNAIGIAQTHREDFRTGFRSAGFEKISIGDGVGSVGVDFDSQDFAAQVVTVR